MKQNIGTIDHTFNIFGFVTKRQSMPEKKTKYEIQTVK